MMNSDDKVFLQVFGSFMMFPLLLQSACGFDAIPETTKFTTAFGVSMLAISMIPPIKVGDDDTPFYFGRGFIDGAKLGSFLFLGFAAAKYLSSE